MAIAQESSTKSPIGKRTPRVDGPLKVTGQAKYTSDFHFPGLLYAVPAEATIANGRILKLDTAKAEKMLGVRAVFHRPHPQQETDKGAVRSMRRFLAEAKVTP